MQSVLPRIWTRVIVFISYDDNHYTTGTSTKNNCIKPSTIFFHLVKRIICLIEKVSLSLSSRIINDISSNILAGPGDDLRIGCEEYCLQQFLDYVFVALRIYIRRMKWTWRCSFKSWSRLLVFNFRANAHGKNMNPYTHWRENSRI